MNITEIIFVFQDVYEDLRGVQTGRGGGAVPDGRGARRLQGGAQEGPQEPRGRHDREGRRGQVRPQLIRMLRKSLSIQDYVTLTRREPSNFARREERKLSILFSSRREEKRMERFRTPHEIFHQTFRTHEITWT